MTKRIDVTMSPYCDFEMDDLIDVERYPDVVVFGNRDFIDFNTEGLFTSLRDHAEEASEEVADFLAGDGYSWYHSVNEIIDDYFDFPVDLTPTQYGEIFRLLCKYNNSRYICDKDFINDDRFILAMYEIIFRKKYTFSTIRGYSQSDWMCILYPVDEPGIYEELEGIYFTGNEYIIDVYYDEDDDDTRDTFAAFYYQDAEEIKKELSAEYDCSIDNVHVYDISGYINTPKYTEVF